MPRLQARSLSFAYRRGARVLDDVSFVLEPGDVVGLVGPNGSGKSTLLRVVSGFLRPTKGEVLLDGASVHALARRPAARRIAGVAAEEEAGFAYAVRSVVGLGRHPWRTTFGGFTRDDEERIDAALTDADLVSLALRPVTELSSGERQRVSLARCFAQGGDLVLLDEPTSHLDLGHRLRLLEVLRRRARAEEQAVLIALHDLNLAATFADRLILLVDGRVVKDGPPVEVLTPDRVREVFGAEALVLEHPETGAPVILPRATEGVT